MSLVQYTDKSVCEMKRWIAIYNTICISLLQCECLAVPLYSAAVAAAAATSAFRKDACAILFLTNVCSQPNLILFNVCYTSTMIGSTRTTCEKHSLTQVTQKIRDKSVFPCRYILLLCVTLYARHMSVVSHLFIFPFIEKVWRM